MRKKCIPGVICVENMTLFLLFFIAVLVAYLYYVHVVKQQNQSSININDENTKMIIVSQPPQGLMPISARRDPFNDPYAPPLQDATGYIYPRGFRDIRGVVPINIETQGLGTQYQQIGILERDGGKQDDLILPLMGRQSMVGRDKWQYYTISNTGTLNTKLPVTFEGRSCTSENGCNNINSGDSVYVKGYNDKFRATIYESNLLQYIPIL